MKLSNLPLTLSFTVLFMLICNDGFSQYLETFSIQNRGVLAGTCNGTEASCTTDYTGVTWVINGDFSGMDSNDFFSTDASGRLNGDGDADAFGIGICFETPLLDISNVGGNVSFTLDLDWFSWDIADVCNVEYQLNGLSWVTLGPLSGTTGPGTVQFGSDGNTGSGIASASGLSGNTLSIRVCYVTNSSFDDIYIDNVNVPEIGVTLFVLPVELISFKARKSEGIVELNWLTGSETNNEKFEIEHSSDRVAFEKIGESQGNGTTSITSTYSFKHKNPTVGNNYYRLRQIDFDGRFEYSDIASVRLETKKNKVGNFYPNPSNTGTVSLDYAAVENSDVQVFIYEVSGRYISKKHSKVVKGENYLTFDFSDFPKGIYLVSIHNDLAFEWRKLIVN